MNYKIIGNKQYRFGDSIYFPGQTFQCNIYLSDDLIRGRLILVNDQTIQPELSIKFDKKKKKQKEVDING